jgi:hypothetical protein
MGGEVGFESERGIGSNFHFTMKLEKGAEIVRPWMATSATSIFKRTHALTLCDSPLIHKVISKYLWSWGIENTPLRNRAETLDSIVDVLNDSMKAFCTGLPGSM